MRLTALLPPPPTPTTLIFAVSIGEKEHLRRKGLDFGSPLLLVRFGKALILVLAQQLKLGDVEFARNDEDEEEIVNSLSCANGVIAIFFISEKKERKMRFLGF